VTASLARSTPLESEEESVVSRPRGVEVGRGQIRDLIGDVGIDCGDIVTVVAAARCVGRWRRRAPTGDAGGRFAVRTDDRDARGVFVRLACVRHLSCISRRSSKPHWFASRPTQSCIDSFHR